MLGSVAAFSVPRSSGAAAFVTQSWWLYQQQQNHYQQQSAVIHYDTAIPSRRRTSSGRTSSGRTTARTTLTTTTTTVLRLTPKEDDPSPDHSNHHSKNSNINNNNEMPAAPAAAAAAKDSELQEDDEDHTFAKKLRIAKAKADIDRMLNGPDPPFDLQTELDKVVSMNAPPSEAENNNEQDLLLRQLEDRIQIMDDDLYDAVKRQDFSTAASIQQEIGQLHLDDCAAVLQVNSAFYRAFSEKNFDKMKQVWQKADGSAVCIHPSHKPMVGKKAILNSWKRVFEAMDGSFQRNWMEPNAVRLAVRGGTAIVTCEEHVYARRFIRGRKRQTELINQMTATNIFRKIGGNWTMVYHHASWHADSAAAKAALKGLMAGGNTVSSSKGGGRMIKSGGSNSNNNNNNNDDDDNDSLRSDGILGIANFGPLLGGGSDFKSSKRGAGGDSSSQQRSSKRIVMGGLSDILGDLMSGQSGGGSVQSGGGSVGGGGDGEDFIFQFHLETDDDDMDDDDDDMDDDDDDDEFEIDEDNVREVTIIKGGWERAESSSTKRGTSSNSRSDSSSSSSNTNTGNGVPKDAVRQNCISALRKLSHQGSISPKQKRVLLTDIIACSAKGEFSMVEVAFELLCGEGDDKDAAEEEFADQCRVFASSLPETPLPRSTTT